MRVRCNSPVGSSPMSSARKSSFSKLLFFRAIPRDPAIARSFAGLETNGQSRFKPNNT